VTVEVIAGGAVLVDDPWCGRLLLDCGVGVLAAAQLRGVPLAGVQRVLVTGRGPERLDPACCGVLPVCGPGDQAAGAEQVDLGAEVAWLVPTSRGTLLHCHASSWPAAVPAGPVQPTIPLAPAVAAAWDGRLEQLPGPRVLVTGGSRSGKSELAEQLAGQLGDVTYVATGPTVPDDPEWTERVRAHQARRPTDWHTVETADLLPLLTAPGGTLLIDGLGTWLAATLDAADAWSTGTVPDTTVLTEAWATTRRTVVLVTDEVGAGVVPPTPAGRLFRDALGRLNATLARQADQVWLATAGIGRRLR